MAQETKVGLLIGLALILLVGLVLSDLFTSGETESAQTVRAATEFGPGAQAGIYEERQTADDPSPFRQQAFDHLPNFVAEPPQSYAAPETARPAETGSAPRNTDGPAAPRPAPRRTTSPSPNLIVEPLSPQLDTLDARTPVARFNESFEAMRLAVENPVETVPDARLLPEPEQPRDTTPAVVLPEPVRLPSTPTAGTTYIHYVQPGQTLRQIARQHYGNPEFAAAISQANPTKVDRDGQVRPGARLEIPPLGSPIFSRLFQPVHAEHAVRVDPAQSIPALPDRPAGPTAQASRSTRAANDSATIEVQPGDTLSELAHEYLGTSKRWDELIQANADQLSSAADLRSGMTLRLPNVEPQTTTTSPSTASASPTPPPAPQNQSADTPNTYTVKAGDNLTRIASRLLGDGERWDEVLAANADQLDRPENLRVGMKLKLPAASAPGPTLTHTAADQPRTSSSEPTGQTYTVQAGDNLTRIAARQLGDGDRWRDLYEANTDQLSSPNDLVAGQTLRLP